MWPAGSGPPLTPFPIYGVLSYVTSQPPAHKKILATCLRDMLIPGNSRRHLSWNALNSPFQTNIYRFYHWIAAHFTLFIGVISIHSWMKKAYYSYWAALALFNLQNSKHLPSVTWALCPQKTMPKSKPTFTHSVGGGSRAENSVWSKRLISAKRPTRRASHYSCRIMALIVRSGRRSRIYLHIDDGWTSWPLNLMCRSVKQYFQQLNTSFL